MTRGQPWNADRRYGKMPGRILGGSEKNASPRSRPITPFSALAPVQHDRNSDKDDDTHLVFRAAGSNSAFKQHVKFSSSSI